MEVIILVSYPHRCLATPKAMKKAFKAKQKEKDARGAQSNSQRSMMIKLFSLV